MGLKTPGEFVCRQYELLSASINLVYIHTASFLYMINYGYLYIAIL